MKETPCWNFHFGRIPWQFESPHHCMVRLSRKLGSARRLLLTLSNIYLQTFFLESFDSFFILLTLSSATLIYLSISRMSQNLAWSLDLKGLVMSNPHLEQRFSVSLGPIVHRTIAQPNACFAICLDCLMNFIFTWFSDRLEAFRAFTQTPQPKLGSELNSLGIKQRYKLTSKRFIERFRIGGRGFPCNPRDQIICPINGCLYLNWFGQSLSRWWKR